MCNEIRVTGGQEFLLAGRWDLGKRKVWRSGCESAFYGEDGRAWLKVALSQKEEMCLYVGRSRLWGPVTSQCWSGWRVIRGQVSTRLQGWTR